MRALIGSLHVKIDKIFALLIGFDGRLRFTAEIGMLGTVNSLNIENLQPCKHCDSLD